MVSTNAENDHMIDLAGKSTYGMKLYISHIEKREFSNVMFLLIVALMASQPISPSGNSRPYDQGLRKPLVSLNKAEN